MIKIINVSDFFLNILGSDSELDFNLRL